jgi:phage terminase large subunit
LTEPRWGELITKNGRLEKYFPVHQGQFDILQSTARYTAAIAGTGGGKTVCGALWLVNEIQKCPMGKFLIVIPTFDVFRQATKDAWENTIAGTPLECEYKVADREYDLPTGGKVFVRSADNPISFQGCVAAAAWVDEGGKISAEGWRTVCQRTSYARARVLITTTPYAHNWLFKDFYGKWKAGNKSYYVRQFPSTLNPTFDVGEYEEKKKEWAAHDFAMMYDGIFQRAAGLVYPHLESCVVDIPKNLPSGRLVGGIDFGFNDPFCGLAGILDHDDTLWLFYERYMRGKTIDEHFPHLPKGVQWWADAARPDSIKDLRRLGLAIKACKKGSGSIQRGINLVHSRINSGRLKIVRGACPNLIEESELYRYPDHEEQTFGDTPLPEHDHAMDSLRYLITGLDGKRRLPC